MVFQGVPHKRSVTVDGVLRKEEVSRISLEPADLDGYGLPLTKPFDDSIRDEI